MNETTWKLLEIGGNWVSGLGSLLAVVVALYLAKQQRAVKLAVLAGERQVATRGSREAPSVLMIRVTNIGQTPATVVLIGWELRMFKKEQGVFLLDDPRSPNHVPVALTTGQQAVFLMHYDGSVILQSLAGLLDGPLPWLRARRLRIVAHTSIGTSVKAKIDSGLRKSILDEHRKMLDQKRATG